MPQKNVNNRAMYWPRGRVWGGSSSLNAMVYVRGHAEDYNRWEREGAAGWGYEAVLPYFKKAQVRSPRVTTPASDLRLVQTHSCGGNEYRGDSGPLHVTRYEARGQLDQAWLEAGQQAGDCTRGRCCPRRRVTCACPGYPLSEDLNGFQQEGVGKMDSTVHGGMRWSAASAYLRPALPRKVGVLVPLTS